MITRWQSLAVGAVLLASPLVGVVTAADISPDTPVASLVSSAKAHLAGGNANEALTYFDAAIARDPENYLTIFQRGAAYLSLGNNGKASADFDRALAIRPDFEGALLQRAKMKSRNADWDGARADYTTAKKQDSPDFERLNEASAAAASAVVAEYSQDWEQCVSLAGTAIMVASTNLGLRKIRARCRLERGEVLEAVSDLQHVSQLMPSAIEPHMQISYQLFYSANERDKAIEQMKKCLRSDPDSRACSKTLRREKNLNKSLQQIDKMKEKRQFNSAVKLLIKTEEEPGLLAEVQEDVKEAREAGHIHQNSPNGLYDALVEMTCEFYIEVNKKKAEPYCADALKADPNSMHGLLLQAHTQIDAEQYEAAISSLNTITQHHPEAQQRVQPLLQKAHTLLKRSKSKDYYKVLGVANDADDRTIKRAYRKMTKLHHPDKAAAQGIDREAAQKRMSEINEAYEVLSDPELRARFDRGDDPNNPEQNQGQPFHGSPFGAGPGGQQFFFRQQGGPGGGGGGGGFKFQQGGGFQFPGGGFQFPG